MASPSTSFNSSAGATLNEFYVSVEIYLSKSAVATRKPRRNVKLEKRESLRTSPSINDLSHRKVKEKSSWLSLSRGSSGTDQWRTATLKLVEEEVGTFLKVYLEETTLYQTVYVHLLHHTEIRQIHRSLFDRKDCVGIFCSAENNNTNVMSVTPEPLYLQFADTEIMNIWIALLRSYATPEVYGRWIYASEGGLYRMWRQVDMDCVQGRNFGAYKLMEEPSFADLDAKLDADPVDIDVYCEVFVGGCLSGRTTVKKGLGSPDWREQFTFTDLPPFANLEIVVWRDKKLARPVMIGSTVIALMNFRRGEQIEGWFPVVSGQLPSGIIVGELRLRLRVDEEIILPHSLYSDMLGVLHAQNCLDWITDLETQLNVRGIQEHVIAIASARGTLAPNIMDLATREIDSTRQSHTTLFRGNSNLTRTMEAYMTIHGAAFLEASVGSVLRRICIEKVSIDTGALRGGKAKHTEKNVELLVHWCQELWRSIEHARDYCPSEMREIFAHIRALIVSKYTVTQDHLPDLPWQGVSAFLFLRFFVPAILHPHLFGFWPGLTEEPVKRTLTQIAKVIQSLANLNTAVHKDDSLRAVKDFLSHNHNTMIGYIDSLSAGNPESSVPVPSPLSTAERHERKRTVNVLKQRTRAQATLHRESIPILPQMIDLTRHLAVVTSIVVRHTRRQLPARTGAPTGRLVDNFCQKCLQVEELALYRVSQLASRLRHRQPEPDGPVFLKSPPDSPSSPSEPFARERKISLPSIRRPKKRNLRPSTAPGGGTPGSRSPSSDASSKPRRHSQELSREDSETLKHPQSPKETVIIKEIPNTHVARLPLMHHPRSTSTDSALMRKSSAPIPASHRPLELFSSNDFGEDPSRRRKGLRGFLRMG